MGRRLPLEGGRVMPRIPGLGSLGQVADPHSLRGCGQVDVRGVNCKVLCEVLLSAAEVWAGSSLGLAGLGYTRW